MFKKWMGVALLAGWLGQGTAAFSQDLPNYGPPSMPDPLPCPPPAAPGAPPPYTKPTINYGPDLVPGPISPQLAPKGPGDDCSLPPTVNNAFPCEEEPAPRHTYFHIGAQGLERQGLGHRNVAFTDGTNASMGLDTGIPPSPGNRVPVLDQNDILPKMNFGVRGTLGYLFEDLGMAAELTGFYIPEYGKSVTRTNPGQLNSYFINPPLGFEGDNGLWLQADRISTGLTTTQASGEFNVRSYSKAYQDSLGVLEPMIGVRYFYLRERFNIFTDDDGLTFPLANGQPDPTREANYATRVTTHFVAPQVGVELQKCVFPGFAVGFYGKAALGASFNQVQASLTRGDGLSGFSVEHERRNFSQFYETGLFFDVYWLERAHVRAGYTTMWLVNVPLASDQVNFDLSQPQSSQKNTGSVFFQGPMVELQLLF